MGTFWNVDIINEGSSVIGHVAYTSRSRMHDPLLKELGYERHTFDFGHRKDELFSSTLLVPPHAPEFWASNPLIVWIEAEKAEVARSTGLFRKRAQLAKTALVHFDRVEGIFLWEQLACLSAFARQVYVDHGLVVQIDAHPYGSPLYPAKDGKDRDRLEEEMRLHPGTKIIDVERVPDEPPCWTEHILRLPDGRHFIYMPHAHLTVSTRTVTPEGFSKKKARHLNPSFANGRITEQEFWTERWVAHQNEWYGARGFDLRIVKTDLLERLRTGNAWRTELGQMEAEAVRDETAELLRDPEVLLDKIVEHNATFSAAEVRYLLRRAGMTPEEAEPLVAEVLRRDDVIPLHDVMTGKRRRIYTRKEVRSQERMVLELSDVIASNRHSVKEEAIQNAIASRTMIPEQLKAFRRHVDGDGITFTQGRAGAGKSYMVGAVREAHEHSGYRVIGLAPTNSVASDMKKDGFAEASTVHAAVLALEKGKTSWNSKTLVVVDEAGMLDTEIMLKLLRHVAASGAKLVMVGDDRQLASVGRGGMWPLLTDRHGASLMNTINRQEADWQKIASVAFSENRIGDAIRAYDDRGFLHWDGSILDAARSLLKQYAKDSAADPDAIRFVYASTNKAVDALNAAIHDMRVARGEVTDTQQFETERGTITMGIGDRLQFYANRKADGIINGLMGTVVAAEPNEIRIRTDAGMEVSIDPEDYKNFGHGYAGTVYRGQGKTVSQAYCFYDNRFAWSAKSAYVAMTRHKKQVDLFVPRELAPDLEHLVRQISREGRDGASLNWATKADLEGFHALAERKAPAETDPHRSTWSRLWANFICRTNKVVATLATPVKGAAAILIKTDEEARGDTEMHAYKATIRRMGGPVLATEYANRMEGFELAETEPAREREMRKLKAIEELAAEIGFDLKRAIRRNDRRDLRKQLVERRQRMRGENSTHQR